MYVICLIVCIVFLANKNDEILKKYKIHEHNKKKVKFYLKLNLESHLRLDY